MCIRDSASPSAERRLPAFESEPWSTWGDRRRARAPPASRSPASGPEALAAWLVRGLAEPRAE
eukprot:2965670-Alexandrium_andersonii.AAC.1